MKSYIEARSEGEAMICAAGLNATILRPWYVLGPGHWWPVALLPIYWLMERIPATRDGAERPGMTLRQQMTLALADAVDRVEPGIRVVDVPGIRAAARPFESRTRRRDGNRPRKGTAPIEGDGGSTARGVSRSFAACDCATLTCRWMAYFFAAAGALFVRSHWRCSFAFAGIVPLAAQAFDAQDGMGSCCRSKDKCCPHRNGGGTTRGPAVSAAGCGCATCGALGFSGAAVALGVERARVSGRLPAQLRFLTEPALASTHDPSISLRQRPPPIL